MTPCHPHLLCQLAGEGDALPRAPELLYRPCSVDCRGEEGRRMSSLWEMARSHDGQMASSGSGGCSKRTIGGLLVGECRPQYKLAL